MAEEAANKVNVAGRQRMLSQKAVKQACMIPVLGDSEARLSGLAATIELFDDSLGLLRFAKSNLVAAPTAEIEATLTGVDSLRQPVKATLEALAGGAALSAGELAQLGRVTEPLLGAMNRAVGRYGGVTGI